MAGRVLSVASEAVPFIKTGGLADVVGALPAALGPLGWEMRVLLPAYRALRKHLSGMAPIWATGDLFGGPARVMGGVVDGVDLLLLDAPHLYDRDGGPYSNAGGDHIDNPERFAALSWAAAALAREGAAGWKPDVLHAHDWQAGFAPAYLAYHGSGGVRSVITVHNIAFQGWADAALLSRLRLPFDAFTPDGLEYYGGLSSLKAALVTADRVTTVSPRYAEELMRPEFGMGLEGVVAKRAREGAVSGILNGVDLAVWSPDAGDHPYSAKALGGKAKAKRALCQELEITGDGPLAIVVSRLTDQKGIDLLAETLPAFVDAGGLVAVLGSGAPEMEFAMRRLSATHAGRVAVRIGYDEGLSRRMFAGGDAVLVPSRFEPCGLTQLYGLRFGTLPLVAATGGLADSVIGATPATLAAGAATGIVFHPTDALALSQALSRLLGLYADKPTWAKMQKAAMAQPVGWETAAAEYSALYESLKP